VALRHLDADFVKTNEQAKGILGQVLANLKGKDYLEMAGKYLLPSENDRLVQMITQNDNANGAAQILMKSTEGVILVQKILSDRNQEDQAAKLMAAIRGIGSPKSLELLQGVAFNKSRSASVRRAAFEALGGSWGGEDLVLSLLKENKIEKDYTPAAVQGVSRAWRRKVRTEAASYLGGAAATGKKIPNINDLLKLTGDPKKGITLFKNHCENCHQVNGEGVDFGPKLSEIGSKLSPEGQYMAILYPDAGISFGYEGWEISLKDGTLLRGMVTSKTETDWVVKTQDGNSQTVRISGMKSKKMIPNSLMLSGFHEAMSEQELADLVSYLMSLKRKG
jgi:putative heme-binding domain-containing protein